MSRKKILEEQLETLNKEIASLGYFIEKCPEGKLIVRTNPRGSYYYSVKKADENGKTIEKYLSQQDQSMATALAKKEYAMACLKDKRHEKWLIEQLLFNETRESHTDHLLNSKPGIANLVLPTLKSYDDYVAEWQDADYVKSGKNPEHLKFATVIPELYVRSKSESLIVSILVKLGIPFRYEEEMRIGKFILHPDFTCMNPRTHEICYLEHQGKWMIPHMSLTNVGGKINTGRSVSIRGKTY